CQKYQNRFIDLMQDIKDLLKNKWTVVLSYSIATTLNKLKLFLDDENITYTQIDNIEMAQNQGIYLLKQAINTSASFEMQRFMIVGSQALNNKTMLATAVREDGEKPKFLPKVGDFVVHQIHGIGKCLGIKNLKLTNCNRDYIVVEYKDGDVLYLPCENADMLSAFVGESNPKCNKIGGVEFFKVKQKVKNSIKEMAFDLIKVYSQRLNSKGYKYSKDSYLQTAFENAFEHPYTQDQITAIKDIKQDMESGKIMDRLVCGDVGFGKTEVALVSAYKTIQEGKQVAIITPTTILCEQHYNTALSRMKEFMVNVDVINRFKTKQEQTKILSDLKDGKIDLICGTHRLLSDDVKFKDLGLIILDEEQRFGVEDKEKLKNLKSTLNVLTLSATPIPRTLYMSLTGIRDVSFLSTPPKERKNINTTVIDYSDALLVEACKREIERGGQVLIVYNKVETITNFYAHVKKLLPDVEIGFAHGQMAPKVLEKAIMDLYSRKTQILISTVLIENGVDLPYANTLFVVDADKLGLSQLYQLRGRIGRSNIEAFAYFSFERNKTLTETSYKRLDAIMEFNDFGSGYKIALRDLEIRGAGDVLGKLQHGHLQQVGYDMYVKLLNEAVNEIKGQDVEVLVETKIDIAKNAYLPQDYISNSEKRIEFYTQIAKIKSLEEVNLFIENKTKELGQMPLAAKQLCYVGFIKNLACRLQIKRILLDEYDCKIVFYKEATDCVFFKNLKQTSADYVLNLDTLPIITLSKNNNMDIQQQKLIKFLLSLSLN
ncbi:MAG: transcription-repair coupling factor, partial [Clostridia bacterium]|nr:transcription-repair coupling factor [Clostridia bacterium]